MINFSLIFKAITLAFLVFWMMVLEASVSTILFVLVVSLLFGILSTLVQYKFSEHVYRPSWFLIEKTCLYSGLTNLVLALKMIFYSEVGHELDEIGGFAIMFGGIIFALVAFYSFSDWSNGPLSDYEKEGWDD